MNRADWNRSVAATTPTAGQLVGDAAFVRAAIIKAKRDALAGKFGPIDDDARRDAEAFLHQYDTVPL